MPHAREQIRDAVVTAVTGLATTGPRVWADRPQARPLRQSDLPALLVSTGGEVIRDTTIHAGALLDRELELLVVAKVRALSGLDDQLDQIALEVETALGGGTLAGGKAVITLARIARPAFEAAGDMPVAEQEMTFLVQYATAADAPGTLV